MNRLRTSSRADLLREALLGRLNATTAALYGFTRPDHEPSRRDLPQGWDPQDQEAQDDPPPSPPPPAPSPVFPKERPRLRFLCATTAEAIVPLPPPVVENPVQEKDLEIPWGQHGVPLQPLIPWSRLAGWLRGRLGARVPGAALDARRLLRRVERGLPVRNIPRLNRAVWSAQALILLDETPEMAPFQADLRWLGIRLRRERGSHGLKVHSLSRPPRAADFAGLAPGAPVLALSALGQYTDRSDVKQLTQAAWVSVARMLAWRGHPLQALTPCPRRLWAEAITSAWPCAEWDRGVRLPRPGAAAAKPAPRADLRTVTEDLLDQLSPASRISPALLRASRFNLHRSADVGVEWQAWHHAEGWNCDDCFGFLPGIALEARFVRRIRFTGEDAAVSLRIVDLIRTDHKSTMSAVRSLEAELRALLSAPVDVGPPDAAVKFLGRVVDRLRRQAISQMPVSDATRLGSLAHWIGELVDGLSPAMRAHEVLRVPLAQSLALSHTLTCPARTALPEGVDEAAYLREIRGLPALYRGDAGEYRADLSADASAVTALRLIPTAVGPERNAVPLARLSAAAGPLLLTLDGQPAARHQLVPAQQLPPVPFAAPQPVSLISTHLRLDFEAVIRPAWAHRMWQDRFGLAAEFLVGGVAFVLRWIPPGRFRMGASKDEPGHEDNEEPQHEVTITKGYWLGETPVTLAQWRAVSLEARKTLRDGQKLQSAPSRFNGADILPVENVNWYDSNPFCELLTELLAAQVPQRFRFHLPTEAQWEHACRAGTSSAFHDGSECTQPRGEDPALAELGWFDMNSESQTHEVKQKRPNAWGLHDMHGNVWEWCADAWDPMAYKRRAIESNNPITQSDNKYAHRGLRGGSWSDLAGLCRAAARASQHPGSRWNSQGLRLAARQEQEGAECPELQPVGGERRASPEAKQNDPFEVAFDNFTPRAQQVLALARKEADRLNHNFLDTAHLLLGLIKLGQGVATNVLQRMGLDLQNVREEIQKLVRSGAEGRVIGKIPYTPRVRRVLSFAANEAKELNHSYVGTEHLLLGLLRDREGVAANVLKNLDVDIELCRKEILMELDPSFQLNAGEEVRGGKYPPVTPLEWKLHLEKPNTEKLQIKKGSSTKSMEFTPRAQQVLALARKEADRFNHSFVGTEHLLLGLIKLGQGVAVNVLQRIGLNLENVRQKVEKEIRGGAEGKVSGSIPYTPRVKKVFSLAAKEAKAMNQTYRDTGHILLGLLREGDGVAAKVLKNLNVDIELCRQEILKELDPRSHS